jgi:hypothetical protein
MGYVNPDKPIILTIPEGEFTLQAMELAVALIGTLMDLKV